MTIGFHQDNLNTKRPHTKYRWFRTRQAGGLSLQDNRTGEDELAASRSDAPGDDVNRSTDIARLPRLPRLPRAAAARDPTVPLLVATRLNIIRSYIYCTRTTPRCMPQPCVSPQKLTRSKRDRLSCNTSHLFKKSNTLRSRAARLVRAGTSQSITRGDETTPSVQHSGTAERPRTSSPVDSRT